MFEFLQGLFNAGPTQPRLRAALTPGRLYAKMSSEFRAESAARGCGCVMPLPYTAEPAKAGACNWQVQPLWSGCSECEDTLAQIVEKYARLYDIRDPLGIETGTFATPIIQHDAWS